MPELRGGVQVGRHFGDARRASSVGPRRGRGGGGGYVFVHQTQIYARGFRSLAEGEEVEYEVELDESGRQRAISVTGPEGDYVQGAPRPPRPDDYDAKYDETY